MFCELDRERRIPPEGWLPDDVPDFGADTMPGTEASASVACSEEGTTDPHEEQNLTLSCSSTEHDGQRIV